MERQKADYFYYVHCLIGLLFMFGFRFLTPVEPLTALGMQVVGIFLGVIYLWSTVGTIWPSILGIIALGTTDYCGIDEAVKNAMGNSTVWTLLTVMILGGAINESGCGELIARWLVSRKFTAGKPLLFSIIFLLAFFFSAIFLSAIAMILLGWLILDSIAKELGYKKGDSYIIMMIVGVHFAGICGTACFPYRGIKLALLKSFADVSGLDANYMVYMLVGIVMSCIVLTLYVFSMKYLFKADFSKIENLDLDKIAKENTRKFTFQEKCYLGSFAVALVLIFCATILPKGTLLVQLFNKISTTNIFALMIAILAMVKKDGKPLLDVRKVAKNAVNWNVVFIVAAAIPIANALTAEDTGVALLFKTLVNPIFEGKTALFFVVVVILAAMILTNLASNVGMGLLLIPIVVALSDVVGVNTQAIGMMVIFAVNFAFCTPAASPVAAMLFGNEWLVGEKIYKYLLFNFVIAFAGILCIVYPLYCVLL